MTNNARSVGHSFIHPLDVLKMNDIIINYFVVSLQLQIS